MNGRIAVLDAVPEPRRPHKPPINQYRKIGFVQTQVAVKLYVSVRRSTKWKPTTFRVPEHTSSEYQRLIWSGNARYPQHEQ